MPQKTSSWSMQNEPKQSAWSTTNTPTPKQSTWAQANTPTSEPLTTRIARKAKQFGGNLLEGSEDLLMSGLDPVRYAEIIAPKYKAGDVSVAGRLANLTKGIGSTVGDALTSGGDPSVFANKQMGRVTQNVMDSPEYAKDISSPGGVLKYGVEGIGVPVSDIKEDWQKGELPSLGLDVGQGVLSLLGIKHAIMGSRPKARATVVPDVHPVPEPGPNIYRPGETINQLPEVAGADPRTIEGRAIIEKARIARQPAIQKLLPAHEPVPNPSREKFISHPSGAVGKAFDINTQEALRSLDQSEFGKINPMKDTLPPIESLPKDNTPPPAIEPKTQRLRGVFRQPSRIIEPPEFSQPKPPPPPPPPPVNPNLAGAREGLLNAKDIMPEAVKRGPGLPEIDTSVVPDTGSSNVRKRIQIQKPILKNGMIESFVEPKEGKNLGQQPEGPFKRLTNPPEKGGSKGYRDITPGEHKRFEVYDENDNLIDKTNDHHESQVWADRENGYVKDVGPEPKGGLPKVDTSVVEPKGQRAGTFDPQRSMKSASFGPVGEYSRTFLRNLHGKMNKVLHGEPITREGIPENAREFFPEKLAPLRLESAASEIRNAIKNFERDSNTVPGQVEELRKTIQEARAYADHLEDTSVPVLDRYFDLAQKFKGGDQSLFSNGSQFHPKAEPRMPVVDTSVVKEPIRSQAKGTGNAKVDAALESARTMKRQGDTRGANLKVQEVIRNLRETGQDALADTVKNEFLKTGGTQPEGPFKRFYEAPEKGSGNLPEVDTSVLKGEVQRIVDEGINKIKAASKVSKSVKDTGAIPELETKKPAPVVAEEKKGPNWGGPQKTVNIGQGLSAAEKAKLPNTRLAYREAAETPKSAPKREHITKRLMNEEFETQQGVKLPKVEPPTKMPNEGESSYIRKSKTDVLPDVIGSGNKIFEQFLEDVKTGKRKWGEKLTPEKIAEYDAKYRGEELPETEGEKPKTIKDIAAMPSNWKSGNKVMLNEPSTEGIGRHIMEADDNKQRWYRATLDKAAPHIKGIKQAARIELGKALDTGDFSKLSADMKARAKGLKAVFDEVHKKFPVKRDVGYIENYFTHMAQEKPSGLYKSLKDLFTRDDIKVPKNPPGQGDFGNKGLGNPDSPFIDKRTGKLKDINYDVKDVLPKYLESVGKVIWDEPAVTKAKEIYKGLPESKMKDYANWYIKNYTGYDSTAKLNNSFKAAAGRLAGKTGRAVVDWNPIIHALHLGELPVDIWPKLKTKHAIAGLKDAALHPIRNWKKMEQLGMLQGELKPSSFKTPGERWASLAQGLYAVERFVKGTAYEGAVRQLREANPTWSEAKISNKAVEMAKDMTLDSSRSRKIKVLSTESNLMGGEGGGILGNQFKAPPIKIAEHMMEIAKNAGKNPKAAAKMILGTGLSLYLTNQGLHTFHLSPADLVKSTLFGPFGSAFYAVSSALYKGDYETAMEEAAAWATPGGRSAKKVYEYATDKEQRDKKKAAKLSEETRSGHPPTNSIKRLVDSFFGEEKKKPSPLSYGR